MASHTDPPPAILKPSLTTAPKPTSQNLSYATLPANGKAAAAAEADQQSLAFVKGGKRKRLSKVCAIAPFFCIHRPNVIRRAMPATRASGDATGPVSSMSHSLYKNSSSHSNSSSL